jgi:hypothetical protein
MAVFDDVLDLLLDDPEQRDLDIEIQGFDRYLVAGNKAGAERIDDDELFDQFIDTGDQAVLF